MFVWTVLFVVFLALVAAALTVVAFSPERDHRRRRVTNRHRFRHQPIPIPVTRPRRRPR